MRTTPEHPATRAETAFVGRERELSALRQGLAAAREGRPHLVIVDGPAGIGKTSLLERFLDEFRELRAVAASGEESEALVAFGVADQMLRLGRSDARDVLDAGDHVAVGLEILALLACDRAPAVIVLDDAHWADDGSLRALLFAARRLVAEPVLIVLLTRDADALPDGLRKRADTRVQIGPLTVAELSALAAAIDQPLPAGAARRLSAHTGGHPLYARALLQELSGESWT